MKEHSKIYKARADRKGHEISKRLSGQKPAKEEIKQGEQNVNKRKKLMPDKEK
jgi:hypothetical protein